MLFRLKSKSKGKSEKRKAKSEKQILRYAKDDKVEVDDKVSVGRQGFGGTKTLRLDEKVEAGRYG